MPARTDIIAEARTWIGTPWAPAGAEKGVGANCLGFLAGVARHVGLTELAAAFAPYRGYALPPEPFTLLLGLRRHLVRIGRAEAAPGDMLLFDLGEGLRHVALLSAPRTIIHAHRSKGRVVEHRSLWTAYGAFRIPGLERSPLAWTRAGPLPHPATQRQYAWGGRVGEGAGSAETEMARD